MKTIGTLATTLALTFSLAGSGLIYPETMQITSIENDVVTMETSTGIVYQMEADPDYREGFLVATLMWSNGTEDVRDDIVISTRCTGF